ncbi:MAG TPA: response regulator [Coleofasciculaceae cyanobacterium]
MKNSCGHRILIVDDLADNLLLMQIFLEGEGYQVDTAAGGWEALEKTASCLPDLILLDVMMPDMDGYEVTRRIRKNKHLPNVPILLITAHHEIDPAEGLQRGADGFVYKPVDLDELLTNVRAFC